jgi:hypothetical protein
VLKKTSFFVHFNDFFLCFLAVCVESCPTVNDYNKFYCRYDVQKNGTHDLTTAEGYYYVAQFKCMYAIETVSLVHRCLPNVNVAQATAAAQQVATASGSNANVTEYRTQANANSGWFVHFIGDMYNLLGYVFGFGLGVTVGVAYLYLLMLNIKGLLFILLWGVIVGVFVLMIIGSFLLWSLSNKWANDDIHSMAEITCMRVFAFFGMGCTVVYFCMIVVLRKRIQLAIGIVKQAARALARMPTMLMVPVTQAIGITMFLVPWVIYVLCLASSGSQIVHEGSYTYGGQEIKYQYKTYTYSDNTRWAFLYMLFMWFWTSEFIIAIGQLTIALSFSLYYFTRDKSTIGPSSVKWAFNTALIYHAGTAAFGSLIIAVIKTIRAVVTYLQRKASKSKNKIMVYVLCMIQCMLWCLEKFMKFISKNAYIMTAIYGYSFCKSTRKAFFVLLRNILRVSAVSIVSSLLLLIGKLFIPIATTFLCYLALGYSYPSKELTGIIGPLVFTFFLSYWIASMFLEIYGMGIETILLCFIADEEMFPIENRFAEGELMSTIQKTAQMHAALKAKVGVVSVSKVHFLNLNSFSKTNYFFF